LLANQGKKQIVDLFLTCTYEGRRTQRGQKHAVISLSGMVKGRTPEQESTAGMVTGKVHFAIDEGYLSLANIKVESEGGNGELTVAHTVEVSMTRVSGNPDRIVATPVLPVPGGPVTKGKAIFTAVLALAANDPMNCPGRPGFLCKLHPMNLLAGKTYIIEMDKVGQSNLDPYLVLVNPQGQVVAQDDDGGGFPNARIIYRSPETGLYRIYATTFARGMTGPYRLTISEEAAVIPGGAGGVYEQAAAFLQKRDFDQAIPFLEKAIAANPNLVKAHSDLGFAYNEKRLYDKAIPCLKKVIELEPNHVIAHNNLGAAYNGKALFDQAIPCFRRAIELDPSHVAAHGNLGFAYNEKRQFDQAIPCFKKVIELSPNNVLAHNNLGVAYNAKALHDQAIPFFKKAIELNPNYAPAHGGLGFAYNAKGSYEQAIPCFKKVIALEPNHAVAHNNLGFAYNAMGHYDQGIPHLKKSVELQPKAPIVWDNLGMALAETGQLEQARNGYKQALALMPNAGPQHEAGKKLLERVEKLLGLEPRLTDIVKGKVKAKDFEEGMPLGRICRVKQHYRAALDHYEQALASDPAAAKKLGPINLLMLARTALFASAGKGNDPPPEAARPQYRAKALAWLRSYVKTQQEAFEKNSTGNRYSCQKDLRVLLLHQDLAAVRAPALNELPPTERQQWESFWSEVDTLLQRADAPIPEPSAGATDG
jgi:tetratricopeptide (TPR) repeat protein